MRGAWIRGMGVLLSAAAVSAVNAQTVTSVEPTILGRSTSRATQRINLSGSFGDNRNITDGLALRVSDDVFGRPTRTYEFDTSNNGITTAGAIAVVPPSASIYTAFTHLTNVINSDPNAPFTARYNYDSVIGNNGWYVLVWKYDNEYRRTSAPFGPSAVELADPGSDIDLAGTFSTNNADNGPVFLQLRGTGLTALAANTSVKLRHQVNTSELYNGIITVKHATSATVSFRTLNAGTGSPPTFPSLGVYNVEINGSSSGQTVTLVKNLLDDPTFRVHTTGSPVAFQWFGVDIVPGPHWMSSPFPGSDIRDNGSANRQICPRLYPFPTGVTKHVSNDINDVDNENMSLQWSTAGGVHRGWQTVNVNFVADTTLTLTGLWAATGDHYPMSYGAQLRAGDQNGTVIAQTPPGQQVVTPFGWTDFSVSGVFPAGTTKATVVFYGQHSTTSKKALHLDDLLLRVDNDHPAPPGITGMTTPNHAAIGDTNVAVTLTGVNLASGQTSVTLRQPDVMPADYFSWADVGRKLVWGGTGQNGGPFGAYEFGAGDKFVVTSGATAILGEYTIADKDDDRVITLAQDINGAVGDEDETITGYIVKAPIAATTVNATGTQVTATFDLTGVPAGYRNIIVEVAAHDPIVWREGLNVIHAGSTLINGSFELPFEPPLNCSGGSRIELPFSPASNWNVRFWNNFLGPGNLSPMLSFRDDFWTPETPFPTCPPPERGAHYASTAIYSFEGTGQWYQTLSTQPGATYTLSGYFGHSGYFGSHGTRITLSLLDGDSAAAPMTGASSMVLSAPAFEDWTFGSVTGTATGNLFTVAWEVECFGPPPSGSRAVWIDHLVLEQDICNDPVADADDDGDVDLDDFAVFQRCYTGQGGSVPAEPAYCECFDTEGTGGIPDGDIDEADLVDFTNCASGPTVPADTNCDD